MLQKALAVKLPRGSYNHLSPLPISPDDDIVRAAGISRRLLSLAKSRGVFNPDSLLSIALFILDRQIERVLPFSETIERGEIPEKEDGRENVWGVSLGRSGPGISSDGGKYATISE